MRSILRSLSMKMKEGSSSFLNSALTSTLGMKAIRNNDQYFGIRGFSSPLAVSLFEFFGFFLKERFHKRVNSV